jgi:hypothetical protein
MPTPIIVHLEGDELLLTGAAQGVEFDVNGDGTKEQVAWTRAGSADAFLVLDRNGNGKIDDGKELFGSITIQPPGEERNGFNALMPFDVTADSKIDTSDPIYRSLLLWSDRNHDGRSEPSELIDLDNAGVMSIGLAYEVGDRVDTHGNVFKYSAVVIMKRGRQTLSRYAWDVVLRTTEKQTQ